MAEDWTRSEVEAAIADYFGMLEAEIRKQPYSKAAHRRALQEVLENRSEGAIEYKHQNISAVLIELGYPYIPGYKPATNYQHLLLEVVEDRLASTGELRRVVEEDVSQPAKAPSVEDILATLVDPPEPKTTAGPKRVRERPVVVRRTIDFLAREARNTSLGLAGEEFAINFEKARLMRVGKPQLADAVEHTSVVQGDGAGYDIRSYESDGSDRFIEVKTTAFGIYTPVYLSSNELLVSQELDRRYHLYRPFQFRKAPQLFTVAGRLDRTLRLEAATYVGRVT